MSGRRRFNCYSDASVEREGEMMYRMVMNEAAQSRALLPEWDRRARMVQRVMDRLIPASGLVDQKWEVHVIESNGGFYCCWVDSKHKRIIDLSSQ